MSTKKRVLRIAQVTALVVMAFLGAQLLFLGVMWLLDAVGVSFTAVNPNLLNSIFAVLVYAIALTAVIAIPWWARRNRTTLENLGIQRLPNWMEVGLSPLFYVGFLLVASVFIYIVTLIFPGIDMDQEQNVGFSMLGRQWEYLVAFLTIVILAPVAEELLFRGYMYERLKRYGGTIIAILIVSVVFGLAHGQMNVALTTFALSVVLCLARDWTGTIWIPILVHMINNGVAFYFQFVSPDLIDTIRTMEEIQ